MNRRLRILAKNSETPIASRFASSIICFAKVSSLSNAGLNIILSHSHSRLNVFSDAAKGLAAEEERTGIILVLKGPLKCPTN
jgi:hypothetical protein